MINRNNYEEYLLLYIDGELSADERQAVESFLETHTDLKKELQLLQQTILQPENDIVFDGKNTLYRKGEGINLRNYQECFLLYVDEELNTSEKEAVETFVLKNPVLQDEFTLLKNTVLPKEPVIFHNKETLYRKEEKRRPVVTMLRWASLAAAVMICIIAMLWIFNSKNKIQPVADKHGAVKENIVPVTVQPQQMQPVHSTEAITETPLVAGHSRANNIQQVIPVKEAGKKQTSSQDQIVIIPKQQIIQPDVTVDLVATNNPGTTNTDFTGSNGSTGTTTNISTPDATDNNVQPAVYTEELNTEDEKNKNLYVGSLQINTDKVRGFFRKAGRFLSNKVKNKDDEDDGKLQVANLELNKLK